MVPEQMKQMLHTVAVMPEGERYSLLHELARKGFVITIRLSLDAAGMLLESITFETQEEAKERKRA